MMYQHPEVHLDPLTGCRGDSAAVILNTSREPVHRPPTHVAVYTTWGSRSSVGTDRLFIASLACEYCAPSSRRFFTSPGGDPPLHVL